VYVSKVPILKPLNCILHLFFCRGKDGIIVITIIANSVTRISKVGIARQPRNVFESFSTREPGTSLTSKEKAFNG
jgi:hypothetical protein